MYFETVFNQKCNGLACVTFSNLCELYVLFKAVLKGLVIND